MEDRCIVCGEVIPEGRQVCPNCEGLKEQHSITEIVTETCDGCIGLYDTDIGKCARCGYNTAIKALLSQVKLKEYIKRLNQPEYTGIVWTKDEVVMLLQELLADRS